MTVSIVIISRKIEIVRISLTQDDDDVKKATVC